MLCRTNAAVGIHIGKKKKEIAVVQKRLLRKLEGMDEVDMS